MKGSSVYNNEKENSAFSSLVVAGEKENSAFSPDLSRPTGRLVKGKVSIQDTGYLGKVLPHGSWLIRWPLAIPWSNAQPALYKTRISLVGDSCGPALPDLGPLLFYHASKVCLRPRSVLWVM